MFEKITRGFSPAKEKLNSSKRKMGFPGGASDKEPTCQCKRQEIRVRALGGEDSPGGGHGNPLQYSCLGNPMDRGAWRATVHRGITKMLDMTKRLTLSFSL